MAQTKQVKLRKCEEHDDCQLQATDGGPWEHTHSAVPVVDRFKILPGWEQEIHDNVSQNLHRSDNVLAWLQEAESRMRSTEHIVGQLDPFLERLTALEEKLHKALRDEARREKAFEDRVKWMDSMLIRSAPQEDRLARVDELFDEVAAFRSELKAEMAAITKRQDDQDQNVKHEREERLAATRKSVQTDRLLAERIGDL